MKSSEEPHHYHSTVCKLCAGEDDEIMVSVSPRRFTLPHTSEKKRKMQIKNKNPYPIYFKAGTSNMDAIRPQPNSGRISAHSKVTVLVQFLDSVIPIKRHEEIVVLTSGKPFVHQSEQNGSVCPYCYNTVHYPKLRKLKKCSHAGQYFADREDYYYPIDSKISRHESIERQSYRCPERERVCDSKILVFQREYGQCQTHCEKQTSKIRNESERPNDERQKLQDFCLHTHIHRMSPKDCDCQNCMYCGTNGQKLETNTIETDHVKTATERKISDPTLTTVKSVDDLQTISKKEGRIMKEDVSQGKKHLKGKVRDKAKEAHVRARIIKAKDFTQTASDTEISYMSSREDVIKKRIKFMSEDEYKKRLAKSNMKKHKEVLDESDSTVTTVKMAAPKKLQKSPVKKFPTSTPLSKKEGRWTVMSIDSKFSFILQLSWANFFLLLLLLLIVVGFATYSSITFNAMDKKRGLYSSCFYDFFS